MKEKFHIIIESYHIADNGLQSNVSETNTQTILTEFFSLLTFHVLACVTHTQTFVE